MTILKAKDKGDFFIVQFIKDAYAINNNIDHARFCGTAYKKLKNMTFPTTVQITSGEIVHRY